MSKNKTTNEPANDIWDACREVVDAEAKRKAQSDAKLKAAALAIGFSQNAGSGLDTAVSALWAESRALDRQLR